MNVKIAILGFAVFILSACKADDSGGPVVADQQVIKGAARAFFISCSENFERDAARKGHDVALLTGGDDYYIPTFCRCVGDTFIGRMGSNEFWEMKRDAADNPNFYKAGRWQTRVVWATTRCVAGIPANELASSPDSTVVHPQILTSFVSAISKICVRGIEEKKGLDDLLVVKQLRANGMTVRKYCDCAYSTFLTSLSAAQFWQFQEDNQFGKALDKEPWKSSFRKADVRCAAGVWADRSS